MRYALTVSLIAGLSTTLLAQQQPGDFEPVLIPVYSSGSGAHGSEWTSTLRIHNDAATEARFADPVYGYPCSFAAPCPAPVPPETTVPFGYAPNQTAGVIVYEPRSHSGEIHYQLRIRDLSRALDTWGTELPVVRESQFHSGSLHLLDFPSDERFRGSLRVYALTRSTPSVRIRIFTQPEPVLDQGVPEAALLVDETLELSWRESHPGEGADFPFRPAFLALHDLADRYPAIGESELVRIQVTPLTSGVPIWAFISVTNNDTQHVTTLTPQTAPE